MYFGEERFWGKNRIFSREGRLDRSVFTLVECSDREFTDCLADELSVGCARSRQPSPSKRGRYAVAKP